MTDSLYKKFGCIDYVCDCMEFASLLRVYYWAGGPTLGYLPCNMRVLAS